MKKVMILGALLALLCGCAGNSDGSGSLTVEEKDWNQSGDVTSNITTYNYIKPGDEVYSGTDAVVTVKSISKNKIVLSVDGNMVERNENGTISLLKDPLKKITLKTGEEIEIDSQTMDAGTTLNIKYAPETASEESWTENVEASISGKEELVKKCLDGYAEYLKTHTELWKNETVYSLDYVNDDDIPDLIFGDTIANHASNIYILTYLDGNYDQVICCGAFGSYGATCYYPQRGIILSSDMGMGYDSEYYSMLSSDKDYGYKTLCHRYFYYEEDYDEEASENKFFIGEDEKEITQEEYDEYVKELVKDTEYKVFYTCDKDKGYEYLTQEALDNRFN